MTKDPSDGSGRPYGDDGRSTDHEVMTTITDHPASNEAPSKLSPAGADTRFSELEARLERQAVRRDGWTLFIFVFSAVALVASIAGVGFGMRAIDESKDNGSGAAGASTSTEVELSEFAVSPAPLEATTSGGLRITNGGSVPHDLHVEGTDLASPMIDPAGSATLDLSSVAPGEYTVYCMVPGHREAGMETTLRVTGADSASTGGSAADGAGWRSRDGGTAMSAEEMDEAAAKRTAAFPAKTEGLGAQPLAPTVLADGTKQFELTTSVVQWEVEPGRKVEAMTYNGTVPGPTLEVAPGERVRVVVTNEMDESTSIHFHGLTTPNAQDGVPDITQPPIRPGETFTYEFTAQDTPAVGMYHSHHNAAVQVPGGLAGAFLVGEQPVPEGVTVAQEQIMMLNDSGEIGFSINGKSFPATAPIVARQGEWIEVSYMNEGQMVHPMHLHGLAQTVIAKDGFPVPQPYQADTILVAPGERYTVLVQAEVPGTWAWHCHILNHAERSDGMFGMVTALVVE